MNCREFAGIVIELARNQALDTTQRTHALLHAELCIHCAARLAEERAWLANVRLVATEINRQEAPARLEAALLVALRAQRQPEPMRKPHAVNTAWLSWRWAVVAMVLLLMAGLAGIAWRSSNGAAPSQEALRVATPLPVSTPPVFAAQVVATPEPMPARVKRRAPQQREARSSVAPSSETAAPFYSLVEEGQMAPLESGRIVRIEVPAATLVQLGVPLTEATLTQPMQADLLLGQDGLARAIRFVPHTPNTRTPE